MLKRILKFQKKRRKFPNRECTTNMKKFARLLALLLACLMLVMIVAACDDTTDVDEDSEQVEDEYGREGDDLPALNYKND